MLIVVDRIFYLLYSQIIIIVTVRTYLLTLINLLLILRKMSTIELYFSYNSMMLMTISYSLILIHPLQQIALTTIGV